MPNVADRGFGGNIDNISGSVAGVNLSQLFFGEWRARSIFGGPAGAIIQSIHVTPRDAANAGPQFPVAGFWNLIGFFSNVQLDANQFFVTDAAKVRDAALDVFLQSLRSTQAVTDVSFAPHGIYVKPNTFAHILCLTGRTAANGNIAIQYDLTVTGRYLDSDALHYKLR